MNYLFSKKEMYSNSCLIEISYIVGDLVSLAPLLCLVEFVAVGLAEAGLLEGLRALVHHGVQRLQRREHPRHVPAQHTVIN